MPRSASQLFLLVLVVIGILAISASGQIPNSDPEDPGSDPQPPPCIADADTQLTASPKEIALGRATRERSAVRVRLI